MPIGSGRLTASIGLSSKVLDNPEKLHSALLHELCHAVCAPGSLHYTSDILHICGLLVCGVMHTIPPVLAIPGI